MRKTCFIIDGDYPYSTGETFLENEINYLAERFESVVIFSYNGNLHGNKTRKIPANVISVPLGTDQTKKRYIIYPLFSLVHKDDTVPHIKARTVKKLALSSYQKGRSQYAFNKIKAWIENGNFDCDNSVIYSYWLTDHALTAVRLGEYLKKKGCETKILSRAHRFDLYAERNKTGAWPYQRYTIERLDAVYACSDDGANYLRKKYPDFSEKISVSRLGTNDHGDKSGDIPPIPVLVTCSNLKKVKRVSLFAEAVCKLVKNGTHVKWICIGDGEELTTIKEIVNEQGCDKNVVLKGRLTNPQVIDFYTNNDITFFCNVSSSEGLPVSIMEAMSFGIPCIATDVGGTGELVNQSNGYLLPENISAENLYCALKEAVEVDSKSYQQLRKKARMDWQEKTNAETNYRRWCDLLAD